MSEQVSMSVKEFDYDEMVQQALKKVVKDSLEYVSKNGLPGSHHFYVTFQTNRDDVKMPDFLRKKHPEEVTIVLQHQFWDLKVSDYGFEVSLSFNDVREKLSVPFAALINFLDPSVKFGLQFTPDEPQKESKPQTKNENPSDADKKTVSDNVVTLDSFRKK
jgi:hypothetical protein